MAARDLQLIEKALRYKCQKMDWRYPYSNSLQAYQKGVDEYAEIKQLADALGIEGERIVNEYRKE